MLHQILFFSALSLLSLGFGFSDSAANSISTGSFSSLRDRFGDYTVTDQKPGFDDTTPLAAGDNHEAYEDPMFADGEPGFYHIRNMWGQLYLDTNVSEATDWSGSLTVNRGAEIIRRVIRFEPNTDYILSRTDRKLVKWVSKTTVHSDGIAVDIVIPRPVAVVDTPTETEIKLENGTVVTIVVDTVFPVFKPVEATFETGPYSSTFTLAEISALDRISHLYGSDLRRELG